MLAATLWKHWWLYLSLFHTFHYSVYDQIIILINPIALIPDWSLNAQWDMSISSFVLVVLIFELCWLPRKRQQVKQGRNQIILQDRYLACQSHQLLVENNSLTHTSPLSLQPKPQLLQTLVLPQTQMAMAIYTIYDQSLQEKQSNTTYTVIQSVPPPPIRSGKTGSPACSSTTAEIVAAQRRQAILIKMRLLAKWRPGHLLHLTWDMQGTT